MLVASDRHTPQDLAAWERVARYDRILAEGITLLEERGMRTIREFAELGACYVSTSWGKDSTVLVDLVGRTGLDIPIVSLVIDGYELPGTEQVRDLVLARHPHLRYYELTLPPQPNRWWSEKTVKRSKYDSDIGWRLIEKRFSPRHITGIRAEESRIRSLIQVRFGDFSRNAARPLGDWKATDIFAYLHKRELPAHPAYAMSHGGRLDRRWLRVHALGGVTGADRGRAEWESAYFGDVITASRHRDAVMEALPYGRAKAVPASTVAAETNLPLHVVQETLMRLDREGLTHCRNHQGRERHHRMVEWPPPPRWSDGWEPSAPSVDTIF